MSSNDSVLDHMSKAIISGDEIAAAEVAAKALDAGISIDKVVMDGVLKAWSDFCAWYAKDEKESLKAWLDCFNATLNILKLLESKIEGPKNPSFSVLVVTVLGEGHVLMKEITATLLRAKGLKVYSSKKGVRIGNVFEALSDPKLRYVVLSCTESEVQEGMRAFVSGVKERRKDVIIIAGGPMASGSGADVVVNDLATFNSIVDSPKEAMG